MHNDTNLFIILCYQAITDGFKELGDFNELINRVKNFIRKVRKSRILLRDFHNIKAFLDISELELAKVCL